MTIALGRCLTVLAAYAFWPACSAPEAPRAVPPVFQVQVPAESTAPSAPQPIGKFVCAAERREVSRRVRFRVNSTTRDGQSGPRETRASYTIRLSQVGRDGQASASVILESLTAGSGEAQSAWNTALERHWVQLGLPFTVTRRGETWCFEGAEPCSDPDQMEISAAIGETIELLDVALLEPQLDGKPSDGNVRLLLPEPFLTRLGLGVVQASDSFANARQANRGFPAVFVTRSESAATEGNARTVSASIEIDQQCHVRSLKAELLSLRSEEGEQSEVRHRFTWHFEPLL